MKVEKAIFAKTFLRSKMVMVVKNIQKNKSKNAKRHDKTIENVQKNKNQIGYVDKMSRIS